MRKSRAVAAGILAIGLLVPRPASADADKEHKLLMAEIRMLQEEQQQLRAVLLGLGDTLKALNSRLDADAARAQKSFADQKLVVEGVAETTAHPAREGRRNQRPPVVDDARAAVAAADRGLDASAGPRRHPARGGRSGRRRPGSVGSGSPDCCVLAATPPPSNVSPTQMWDRVYAVYTAGQWDLAVEGFQSYIRTFPTSPQADDAQLYIGHSLYSAGKYPEAVDRAAARDLELPAVRQRPDRVLQARVDLRGD